jgi:hypothetical protein
MKKLLLILVALATVTLGYSQPTKKPKIEDVVIPSRDFEQMQREKYQARLDSVNKHSVSCIEIIVKARMENDSLRNVISDLKEQNKEQRVDVHNAKVTETAATNMVNKERTKKRVWTKLAIGEGAVIVGGIVGAITGAWVPICIAVGVVELYLIVEGKVQINIKQTKI